MNSEEQFRETFEKAYEIIGEMFIEIAHLDNLRAVDSIRIYTIEILRRLEKAVHPGYDFLEKDEIHLIEISAYERMLADLRDDINERLQTQKWNTEPPE